MPNNAHQRTCEARAAARSAILAGFFAVNLCIAGPAVASEAATEQERVVEAMRLMYVAATNDDLAQFRAVTTPDFHAFETENFIILPWDREIIQGGELVMRPDYAARL